MSASDPVITRFALKRFLFSFGIRKIIQARNQIYLTEEQQSWYIKEEFLEPGSEVEYIKEQAKKQIGPFQNDYNWMGSDESYIDLTIDNDQENYEKPNMEEDMVDNQNQEFLDSDVSFLEMVNQEKLNKQEDFVFGKIGDLPEEFYPFLREELLNNFSKESYEVIFPSETLTNDEMDKILQESNPKKESLQHLFELLKTTHNFITTKDQKRVFWSIYLSPDIGLLQLEKNFGLFAASHLKVTEASIKQKVVADSSKNNN